ncbi:phage tail-collar fiber domain-containing protein [Photobacterium phosphoreum]|uniref:phage tail-collar fiber domain-containing protein n=1 Tax=Photobacterium phosphoreum TaxID=659 RepID=UPI0006990EBB|nr:phage tail protein [Photobacterium phosphoreum]PSV68879.1 hypothetical protein CTM77_16150 [Photobacterium phosphoreum]
MAQTVIPFSFETYLQKKLASGDPVTLNKIVLANIPDLDLTQPIPRDTGLPTHDQIVHEQIIDQVGKINTNALAYSIVMDTTMGDFTFNAMYLIDKDDRNSIGMIVWKLPETKTATNEQSGTTGNSLVKSMLMEYDGAATAAAITVTAATWQIDYSARLIGIDDDVRLQALDVYGHDAFIDDGFVVTKATNTDQYFVNAGIGYIGGLRAVLAQNQTLTISTKPTSIWVSVSHQGTVLGAWSNAIELKVSATALTDNVIDGVDHYVAKIADITAEGMVVNQRSETPLDVLLVELKKGQFQAWDPLRLYTKGEKTTVKQGDESVDFWCNQSNVNHKPISNDPTDTWRLYPFEKGSNQGISYKIWFNNDVEMEGVYSLTTYKTPMGGNLTALYDGSTSILLPIPMTVTTCHASQIDSGNVGVETTTCAISNNYIAIRAGGVSANLAGSASYVAKGSWFIKGYK